MTLADRAGKTVLLNLWATWCVPCREEMPALNALQKEAGQRRIRGHRRSTSTPATTPSRRNSWPKPASTLCGFYRDNTLALFNDLKKRGLALGLPVTLLIDADGCLLGHMNGPAALGGRMTRGG